jgi:2'-5' RNA ligase
VRLFVALPVPPELRARIHEAATVLRDRDLPVRWVDPDLYHLTLKFLGTVDRDAPERITPALDRVASENAPFEAGLGDLGAFPSIRKPRVLWIAVDPTPALRCLKQDVEWALAKVGFDRDTRAFHPHVTLGRARDDGRAGAFRGLDEVVANRTVDASLPVSEVRLVRSRLSRSGPRYAALHTRELGPGTDG